ncbi:MAG: hypothetical protein GYA56_07595 [Geobacteraceae bacterium]|nr:hypothetical protein [Geobacteraceae bacterium]
MAEDLRVEGARVGKNRIWRLMREHFLRVKTAEVQGHDGLRSQALGLAINSFLSVCEVFGKPF